MNHSVERVLIRLNIKITISVQLIHPFQNLFRSRGRNLFSAASPRIDNGVKDTGRRSQPFMPSFLRHVVHVLKNSFGSSCCRSTFPALGPCINYKADRQNEIKKDDMVSITVSQFQTKTLPHPHLLFYFLPAMVYIFVVNTILVFPASYSSCARLSHISTMVAPCEDLVLAHPFMIADNGTT